MRRAIGLCPKHGRALNNLALILEERGDLDGAEKYYRRASNIKDVGVAPYAGLGDVYPAKLGLVQITVPAVMITATVLARPIC